MGQALYRKYRSKSLDEVIGQEHITKTLSQAIKAGRISHAYLLTGPRGTGKTSVARILAHEINGLPYTDDSMHIDIIEIDAASNRRIDEIRELRDKVYIAPTSAKYKVYIIDEVHMLTKEAFNALLKTLEEPPAHVVFILATTDAHKLPDTIVSRTQRFTFKPIETPKIVAHLKHIAKEEGISVSDEALQLLAEHGGGSFRDSISLLDQASSQGTKLEVTDVQSLLGIPPAETIQALLEALVSNAQVSVLVKQLSALYDQGYQAAAIAKQLAHALRLQLVQNRLQLSPVLTLSLLGQLIDIPAAHDPERYLEIVLLQALKPTEIQAIESAEPEVIPEPIIESSPDDAQVFKSSTKPTPTVSEPEVVVTPTPKKTSESAKAKATVPLDAATWPAILSALKQKYNTLYGVVRMAQPTFHEDNKLELAFSFAFHQKRISEAKNRQLLADTIKEVTGQDVQIDCVLDKNALPPKTPVISEILPENTNEQLVSDITTISNIFGGGELLES